MICGTFTLNCRLQRKATTTSRLRSMTLSQLASQVERDLNFAQGTSQTGSLHLLTKNVFNVGVLFGDIYRINLHTWFTESRGRWPWNFLQPDVDWWMFHLPLWLRRCSIRGTVQQLCCHDSLWTLLLSPVLAAPPGVQHLWRADNSELHGKSTYFPIVFPSWGCWWGPATLCSEEKQN